MLRVVLVLAALVALPASADEVSNLRDLTAVDVAQMIDATSFPNSIGPRRQDGLKTFADYGFTEVELVGSAAELYEPDRSWMISVTILDADDDEVVACILDRALGGPSYHTQKAIVFERGDGGLLVAAEADVTDPACPKRP